MAFCSGTYANNVEISQISNVRIENPLKELDTEAMRRSESIQWTDKCGDTYTISWSCNFDCSDDQIVDAINDYIVNNLCT